MTHSELTPEQESSDVFGTRVVVQSPPATERDKYKRGGFFAVGLINSWDIDFASTLPEAVSEALSHSFEYVTVENEYRKGCDECGMIVRPKIIDFRLSKITMQAIVELEVDVYDANDRRVATFKHEGQSPYLSLSRAGVIGAGFVVPLIGTALGKPVVNATVKGALDNALEDVKERFANESLDGGVLARVWRPKKTEYGKHEYAAELVARKLGCDLRSDGLNLVNELYGKELYDVQCWSHGNFAIACELGRCEAKLEPDHPLASQIEQFNTVN